MWASLRIGFLTLAMLVINNVGMSQSKGQKMRHGKTSIYSIRYFPDGKRFISASYDGTVMMWDIRSGKPVWQLDLDAGLKSKDSYTISNILGMALSEDGKIVAVSYDRSHVVRETLKGGGEFHIALLDSKTGQVRRVLIGHTSLIGRIAFSPNVELLLSESGDSTARLWNVNTGQEVLVIKLKERGAAVAFSPDGKLFAVATQPVFGSQPIIGLYDVESGKLVREFDRTMNAASALAFSPDGKALAIVGGDASGSQIDIWELAAQAPKTTLPMPGRVIKAIAFPRDGGSLALGGYGNGKGFVEIRDMKANRIARTNKFESDVTALDFSPDGKRLLIATDKGQIVVLPLQTHGQ